METSNTHYRNNSIDSIDNIDSIDSIKRSIPMRHRNILSKRQSSAQAQNKSRRTTSSVVFIVFALCIPDFQTSHALVTRAGQMQRMGHHHPPLNVHRRITRMPTATTSATTTTTTTRRTTTTTAGPCFGFNHRSTSPSGVVSRTTSLQYQDYRSNDESDDVNRCQSLDIDVEVDIEVEGLSNEPIQHQQQQKAAPLSSSNRKASHERNNNHHISNFFHTLWTSGKTKRAQELHAKQQRQQQRQRQQRLQARKETSNPNPIRVRVEPTPEQRIIDEYLESIDRRYKRLHEKDDTTPKSFNVLQWLTQGPNADEYSELEEQRKQEDAIYVLGLADLASTSLLQKHHLPIPKSKLKVNKAVVIDIDIDIDVDIDIDIDTNDIIKTTEQAQAQAIEAPSSTATNQAKAIKATTTDSTTATPAPIIQVLRTLQAFDLSKAMTTYTKQLQELTRQCVGLCGKALLQATGGQHSFQLASLLFTSIFAFVLSSVRPFTKA